MEILQIDGYRFPISKKKETIYYPLKNKLPKGWNVQLLHKIYHKHWCKPPHMQEHPLKMKKW